MRVVYCRNTHLIYVRQIRSFSFENQNVVFRVKQNHLKNILFQQTILIPKKVYFI